MIPLSERKNERKCLKSKRINCGYFSKCRMTMSFTLTENYREMINHHSKTLMYERRSALHEMQVYPELGILEEGNMSRQLWHIISS